GFWLPSPGVDVWLPFDAASPTEPVDIVGRLRPGATIEQAQSEFDVLAQRGSGRAADPLNNRTLLRTFRGESVATMWPRIQGLIGPALALLLIACANVGNLLVIRMLSRQRELSIRVALGATAARLGRSLFVETMLPGTIGGLAGLLLAAWGLKLLRFGVAS